MPTEVKKEYDLSELKARVAERLQNPSTAEIGDVVDAVFQEIMFSTATYNRMDLHNFGVFKLKNRAARSGTSPNGKPYSTPERLEVVFSASPLFKRTVKEVTDMEVV